MSKLSLVQNYIYPINLYIESIDFIKVYFHFCRYNQS
jgi:hypothetical protein